MLAHGIYTEHIVAGASVVIGTAAGGWSLVRSSRSVSGAVALAGVAILCPVIALAVAAAERGDAASTLKDFWMICLLPGGVGLLAMVAALLEQRSAKRDRDV